MLTSDEEILLAHAFGCDRLHTRLALADFKKFVKRRGQGEPVAYITGTKEFYGRDFEVTPAVLIPRPDTEKLVELALKRIPLNQELWVIDACTGSGCIGITLALERPQIHVIATELSSDAAQIARRNAKRYGVLERFQVLEGNLLDPVPARSQGYHLLVANPPYVKPTDMKTLMKDVQDFEPHLALEGLGEDGIGHHEAILSAASKLLMLGAVVLLEIGYDQKDFFEHRGLVHLDDAGNPRVVEIVCA